MTDISETIEQNLIDAGCGRKFIEKFMNLPEEQRAEMLKMLDDHRKILLDGIHKDERKIFCLDYLINRFNNKP